MTVASTLTGNRHGDRWLGLLMALAVTLLLSVVPLKTPFVDIGLLESPQAPLTTQAGARFEPLTSRLAVNTAPTLVSPIEALPLNASGRDYTPDPGGPTLGRIFAGVRANAALPPTRARQTALPPVHHQRFRAPPACA